MCGSAKSYFKVGSRFVPLGEFRGPIADPNYIEGAIECEVDGRSLLTVEHWDLVDQLWAYVVEGLTKLEAGQEYDAYFPDQPLRIRLRPISPTTAEVTIGDRSQRVTIRHLVHVLAAGASEFFDTMNSLYPPHSDTWNKYRAQAIAVASRVARPAESAGEDFGGPA